MNEEQCHMPKLNFKNLNPTSPVFRVTILLNNKHYYRYIIEMYTISHACHLLCLFLAGLFAGSLGWWPGSKPPWLMW